MIIVASGPSARGFIPPSDIPVIAVNGAIDWIERADYWFTLDPDEKNTARMENQRDGVIYFAAVSQGTICPPKVCVLNRVHNDWFPAYRYGTPEWWLSRWKCRLGLSEQDGDISTGNSAYGALGLAKHLGARKVIMIGVDGTEEEKIEGGAPYNLSHLPLLFSSAVGQISFVSCGKLRAEGVPNMTIEEGIEWLRS